ncbi:MAG TPA: PilN domain-containing protein [Gemmatimonadaceae bacterium]|jgi:Tfp pilus assembly protein PilN|nr:PilN domain-containing protein [Gemmatimonadaceae bacterium]
MIEINLLPGSGKKNRGTGFSLTAIAGKAGSRVKDPFMIAAAVSIVAATGSIAWLHVTQTARAEELTERERRAVQDSTRYVAVLRERNRALAQRDSIQRQLEIIKTIDNDRFVWPHVMDEVSRALPPYTWLKGIQQVAVVAPPPPPPPKPSEQGKPAPPPPPPAPPAMKFQVFGNTADIQALTRFMKLLEASPFVKNVAIAKAELVALDGKEVHEFLLEAEYERPDESVISTVPVTLSSR